MFLPSLVVLLCAVGASAILVAGRLLRSRAQRLGKAPCQLIARVDLSPQHVLYVVETAERRLLLGGAPGGLSLLTELPPTGARVMPPEREATGDVAAKKEMAA